MKKMFLVLLFAVGDMALGMEQAINQCDWRRVKVLLYNANSDELNGYIKTLTNSKADLRKIADNTSLFQELLVSAVSQLIYNTPQKGCAQVRLGLKELIKCDKLDLNLRMSFNGSEQSVVTLLDNAWPENAVQKAIASKPYSNFLTTLCDEIYDEDRKSPWHFTTIFHNYESSMHGFSKRCKLKWSPLCLLADYRVWAVIGTSIFAACFHSLYKKAVEQKEDAEDDEQKTETNLDEVKNDEQQ